MELVESVEYKSKKVPAEVDPLLHEFQARYMLQSGHKITEGKAIQLCVAHALEHWEALMPRKNKPKYTVKDLIGIIKGGPHTNAAEEVDRIVYGV